MYSETAVSSEDISMISAPRWLWWRRFFIRLKSWEYWPLYIFNIPVLGIWLWNAIRARDLFFFTLTNPGIATGGMFGESKSKILHHIPARFKPGTVLIPSSASAMEAEDLLTAAGLSFPLIAKPEVGERGWLIEKIHTIAQLHIYRAYHPIDTILQAYVDLPVELSIMVYRMPDGSHSHVTSVCEKHFLQIRGDGQRSIGELILSDDRATLQFEKLVTRWGHRWYDILSDGEILILEHVGNHCRGTMFLNRNERIDEAITRTMVSMLACMPEVWYGRFDMRVESWEALLKGRGIQVMEFNGTGSDPAHIFQPGYPLMLAYKDMAWHWGLMRRIARLNRQQGYRRARMKDILSALILYFRYKRTN